MKWIERQRLFIDFTLASLWRRKWKNAALLLVYALVVFFIASVIFFTRALHQEAEAVLAGAPEMIVQRMMAGRYQPIPVEYAGKISKIRGARHVRPRLWGYYYHMAAGSNYTIMVPDDFAHPDDAVEIGSGVLRTWGTIEGGQLYFKSHDGSPIVLNVAGTLDGSTELVSADLVLMSEMTFRRISGIPAGFAADLAITVRNERECPIIAEKINLELPDTRVILKEEILRTYAALFDWRSGYLVVMLAGAVLAFFIFAWDKATGLSAEEKAEIGILKGLGWDTGDILMMKFWEGGLVSITAFLVGVIGGYLHVFLASATIFEHALKGWAVLYPQFTLKPVVDPYQLSILFFLTVVPYTLITLVPSWAVAVTDPDTVMRH